MDWWTFTKLAIPGLLMVGFEWWSYEIGIVVVGAIDKTQLGIYIIALNIATILFMVSCRALKDGEGAERGGTRMRC